MGVSPKKTTWVAHGTTIDIGSNVLFSVGLSLLPTAFLSSMHNTKPVSGDYSNRISRIGYFIHTIAKLDIYFHFEEKESPVSPNIVPGTVTLVISHKDHNYRSLHYQTFHNTIYQSQAGYKENVELQNYLPNLTSSKHGYLSTMQLRIIHRNLEDPSIEKQLTVLENVDSEDLPEDDSSRLDEFVTSFHACRMKLANPRQFMFTIRDPVVKQFNCPFQIELVTLIVINVGHAIDVGAGFRSEGFINNMEASTERKQPDLYWINVYDGAFDYISSDAETNFKSTEFKEQCSTSGSLQQVDTTEVHYRIGLVDQSRSYLRSVHDKLRTDLPLISRRMRLSMFSRAMSDVRRSETSISQRTVNATHTQQFLIQASALHFARAKFAHHQLYSHFL